MPPDQAKSPEPVSESDRRIVPLMSEGILIGVMLGSFVGFVSGFAWGPYLASLSFFGPILTVEQCLVAGFWTGMLGAIFGAVVSGVVYGLITGLGALGEICFRRGRRGG